MTVKVMEPVVGVLTRSWEESVMESKLRESVSDVGKEATEATTLRAEVPGLAEELFGDRAELDTQLVCTAAELPTRTPPVAKRPK